ncbi:MAG: peptide ABC transporter substrate-binding protein, partial [Rhodospirillales bacterium]|nr:peptide ABC transporter substrate-binding protein [Rhodospirillales bacterium]
QALAFEKRHHERYDVLYKPGLVYEHIEPNLALPALADRRVRRALLMGIDREAMVAQLFGGRQPVAVTGVSPLDWVFAKDLKPVPYDPKAAGQLLDEAGWLLGEGKVRRNAKGEGLAVDLMTTAGNRARELVQQVVQSQWKRLGIDVRIRNEPARVFFGETVTHRNFQGLALFAWISSPENVPRTTLHSEGIPTADNNWAGQNYTGYNNSEMDALLEKIELELDRDRRAALWRRFQEIYLADLPALPLFFRADAYILPKWLKGIEPTGHQYATTLWVEHWRAE